MRKIYVAILISMFTTAILAKKEEESVCPSNTCQTTWLQMLGEAGLIFLAWQGLEARYPTLVNLRQAAIEKGTPLAMQGLTYVIALARVLPGLKVIFGPPHLLNINKAE